MTISQDITEQVAQCCVNIADAVEQAGSNLDQVVRVNYVLPDGSLFERCWPAMRAAFASARPEAMMIGAGLSSPAMKIEVTALKCSDAQFSGAPSSPERPVLRSAQFSWGEGAGPRNASRQKAARSGENWGPGLPRPGFPSLQARAGTATDCAPRETGSRRPGGWTAAGCTLPTHSLHRLTRSPTPPTHPVRHRPGPPPTRRHSVG